MPTLSIISSSPKSGKTAVAVALGLHYQQQGQRVAWLKPVSTAVVEEDGAPVDRDAQFVRETLKLPETAARGPVLITPGLLGEKLDEVLWARELRGSVPGTRGTLGTRRNWHENRRTRGAGGAQLPAGAWGVPTNLPPFFIREDERRS